MGKNIALSDEFAHRSGQFPNYDSYVVEDRLRLQDQKHVDIRSFLPDDQATEWRMLNFDQVRMTDLGALDMSALQSTRVQNPGENWTAGTVSRQADRNNWPGISLECPVGETRTESISAFTTDVPEGDLKVNLIKNPSAETGIATYQLSNTAGIISPTIESSGAWAKFGKKSLRLRATNANDAVSRVVSVYTPGSGLAGVSVEPGEEYTALAFYNVVSAITDLSRGYRLFIHWYQASGAISAILASSSSSAVRVVGQHMMTVTATAPSDAAFAAIRIHGNTAVANELIDFYADGISLIGGATPNYFDGDMPGYRWDGVPHASTSSGPYRIEAKKIDIESEFEDDDFLSIALPDFPLSSINLNASYVDLTSHETGSFAGSIASVPLADSLIPLVQGDSEFRVERSELDDIDLSLITGVRFRIVATVACTFRAMAIRLLSKDWKYVDLDLDTRAEVLRRTVSPNGSIARAHDWKFPTVFRAADPPGTGDPRPINASLAATFFTGSKVGANQIQFIFRESPGDFTQQIDLNELEMSALNGDPQPNLVNISYKGRTQAELDRFRQTELSDDTQTQIERTVDPEIRSYLSAMIQWSSSQTVVSLLNSEGRPGSSESNGFSFTDVTPLAPNTHYIFIADVENKTMRGRIYPLDRSGNIRIGEVVYDTGLIIDEFSYARRPGRFGWKVNLQDGDAYIEAMRVRSQTYAEITTSAFESVTPVEGAELSVSGSPNLNFFDSLYEADFYDFNIELTRDADRSLSGNSYRIINPGTLAPQGVMTNLADFYDFSQMEVSFDVYYPQNAIDAGIELQAFLSNEEGRIIPLEMGEILGDRWYNVRVTPGNIEAQTGRYRLYIIQSNGGAPTTWWVDNIRIEERVLSFYARSTFQDPWGDARIDWVPFRNTVNSNGGVQFLQRGRHLQILGKAHRNNARIQGIKVTPRYAQLGRFVWCEDELYNPRQPVASIAHSVDDFTVDFDGTASHDPDGDLLNYFWNFGDGSTASGPVLSHTYAKNGDYEATLVVTDRNGLQGRATISFTIQVI